jgi:hypothetical protein
MVSTMSEGGMNTRLRILGERKVLGKKRKQTTINRRTELSFS